MLRGAGRLRVPPSAYRVWSVTMPPMLTKRPGLLGVAAIVISVAVGCPGGASDRAPPVRNSTGGRTGASRTGVPNPFTVVATYSAASLGLRNPRALAFGPDGNLYVADATDRVTVSTATGTRSIPSTPILR